MIHSLAVVQHGETFTGSKGISSETSGANIVIIVIIIIIIGLIATTLFSHKK